MAEKKQQSAKKAPARKAPTKTAPAEKASTKKAPAAKKQPAKTTSPAKQQPAKPQQNEYRADLISKIVEIAEGLEDDGLELLLEQAKTVEYKGKIEKFNRRLNVAAKEAIEARHAASRPDYFASIEQNEDGFFIIQLDDARVFFNLQEMRELTRICHKAKDEKAGARNLFRWFEVERSDLLADAGISSNRSPYLTNLYEEIVSNYKVKE